ncbi:MAG: Fic family protein [Mycoplasmataceae bacterium]|nr:Fic family protein [Mycoplasmataceae bacterium]
MINKIMKYIKYPTESEKKYSTKSFEHLMGNRVDLPLNKNGNNFYYYDSSTLQATIKDMRDLLSSIEISNKNINFFHFNEIKSSLSIEGEEYSINNISEDIRNNQGMVNSMHEAYKLGINNPVISKASLISVFVTMQKHSDNFESDYRKGDIFITDGIKFQPREKPQNIPRRIDELFTFINETKIDPIILSFMTHYVYEDIHPFYDFNGRTGRLLLNMILAKKTGMTIPYLSSAINAFRKEYYKSFEVVDKSYDLTYFIFNMITSLYKYVKAFKQASTYDLSPSLIELLTNIYILDKRSFTIYELKDKMRVTGQRASLHEKLRRLVKEGILEDRPGHTKKYILK